MLSSTVTQKGQVTIPIEIRKELSIRQGDKVSFIKSGNSITITAMHKVPLKALCGFLPKPSRSVSVEEMNEIIANKGL